VFLVGNGERTDFWGEAMCGQIPVRNKFPDLYEICNDKSSILVAKMTARRCRVSFRRWFDPS
jgi:hypothetical protein